MKSPTFNVYNWTNHTLTVGLINLLSCFTLVYAQDDFKVPDSLIGKTYSHLDNMLDSDDNGESLDSIYAWSYMAKAKKDKNPRHIITAYKHLLYNSPKESRIVYADSMVATALSTKDDLLIGSAYLSRGIVFYGLHKYSEALPNYIKANDYLSKTTDKYQIYKAKYNLGLIKYYLEYYDEAFALFRLCIDFYEKTGGKPYLHSLHSLALCYQAMERPEESTATNNIGIKASKATGDYDMISYFEHCEGVNQYFKGSYNSSISLLKKSLPQILKFQDGSNAAVGYFYVAKSYIGNNEMRKAIPYLIKVDSIARTGTFLRDDVWSSYDILIAYYSSIKDYKKANYYKDYLVGNARENMKDYQSLSRKMVREFYTKRFKESESKKELITNDRNNSRIAVGILIVVLVLVIWYFVRRQKKQLRVNKQKFKNFYTQENYNTPTIGKTDSQNVDNISPEISDKIYNALNEFEEKELYRNKDVGLTEIARFCNSNNSYVSKVINHRKNHSVPDYIDSLRIGYIHHKLRTDKDYKKYTMSALAEDAGYKTPQKFTNAFKTHTKGLLPSFYVEQLSKETQDQ